MIEKKIHYCWFGKRPLSRLNQKCIDSWKRYLPDYEIIRWDESNSPLEHPYVQAAIQNKMYAFAADYVRLWAVEKFGGLYMDTDMELIKSPCEIFSTLDFFAGYEQKDVVNMAIFGVSKENPIIKDMISYIESRCIPLKRFVTIPVIATHALKQHDPSRYSIFPERFFYPYNPSIPDVDHQLMFSSITPDTYAIHHWEKTWGKKNLRDRFIRKARRVFHFGWRVEFKIV